MVEISKIIEQNPWWKFGEEFISYDKSMRKFGNAKLKIERKPITLKPGDIYAIHGPRQVGKTTEIKKIILKLIKEGVNPESICYFSCDVLISRKELQKVLDFFLDKIAEHKNIYLFLDEINFIKDWVPEIKRIADSEKSSKTTILFTGSPFGIKIHSHELIGRGIEGNRYFMKPLSFRDFVTQICKGEFELTSDTSLKEELNILSSYLDNRNYISLNQPLEKAKPLFKKQLKFIRSLNFLFDIYLKTGGFPAVINGYIDRKEERERIASGFYETFIDLVIKDTMKQGKNEGITQQILTAIIKKTGSRYNFRAIVEETEGISHPTVIDYLQLLEDNFLVNILYSYDFNKKIKRYKGAKKIYFTDPFIFHSFNSWLYGKTPYSFSQEFLLKEDNVSLLVESIVQNQLAKIKEIPVTKSADRYLWFYYDARKELDFIYLNENEKYVGIEVKYKPKTTFKDTSTVSQIKEYLVPSRNEFEINENMVIVPASIFLSLLESSERNL